MTEFVLFTLTLVGVAVFHHRTLQVALVGLAAIALYKLGFTGFKAGPGLAGLGSHLLHEWVILANLLGLLPQCSMSPLDRGQVSRFTS